MVIARNDLTEEMGKLVEEEIALREKLGEKKTEMYAKACNMYEELCKNEKRFNSFEDMKLEWILIQLSQELADAYMKEQGWSMTDDGRYIIPSEKGE